MRLAMRQGIGSTTHATRHGLACSSRISLFLTLTSIAAVLAFGVGPARAQLPFKVSVAGGWSFAASPSEVSDFWGNGVGIAAGVQFRVASRIGAWVEVGYHRIAFDASAFEAAIANDFPNVNADGNDLLILPVHAGADVSLTAWGNTRPYLTGGLGYDHIGHTDPSASGPGAASVVFPDRSADCFGTRIGAGVRTLLTPAMTLFFDAAWQTAWASPDPFSFVPVRIGLRF